MENRELGEALTTVAKQLGIRVLSSLSHRLDPDELMAEARELLGGEMRGAFIELLQDPETEPLRTLIDQLFKKLDEDALIAAIAPSLATALTEWFKTEEGAIDTLVTAIVEEMDLDELKEIVAEKVANRVQIAPD